MMLSRSNPGFKLFIFLLLAITAIIFLVAGTAFAEKAVRLVVDGKEISPDVPPQLIDGRAVAPVREVAEALGAKVAWDAGSRTVKVVAGDWLGQLAGSLARAGDEFKPAPDVKGEVKKLWRVGERCFLLEHVWNMDYSYFLCDAETDEKDLIVGFLESARLKEAGDDELVFVAKGGGDCGDYSFPYLLRYDVENKKLSREELYLTRSVAFGASGAWEHVFKGVSFKDGAVALELAVAPEQVLAGGHKRPFTVVDRRHDGLTVRIYGVRCPKSSEGELKPDHPLIERISWRALPAQEPVANEDLLKEDFPYGAALKSTAAIQGPSLLVEIDTKGEPVYNIDTSSTPNHKLTYIVKIK